MAEKNIIIEKALNDNYLDVQKKEIEVDKISVKLAKDFSKNTSKFARDLKGEQKEVTKQKNTTKAKYKTDLDSIKKQHDKHLEVLLKSKEEVEKDFSKEMETAEVLIDSENTEINKAIESIEEDYLKQVEGAQKEYEDNISHSDIKYATDKINSDAISDKEKLSEKSDNDKEKHTEKLASLNDKHAKKLDKLNESGNKKLAKAIEDIAKEEEKTANELEELKNAFNENIEDIDTKCSGEINQFDTKYDAISSTLESKVARHEKFMNKSVDDNDQRAAKQHKKEIAILQKNAEKELKLLTSEHNDKSKVFAPKKKALVHENFQSIAVISKELIKFKEDKLYEIETSKSGLNRDIEVLKFDTDIKIQEEINKFDEIQRDNAIKLSGIIIKHELDLAQVHDTQAKLNIVFEKENTFNKLKYDEALASKTNELYVANANNELSTKLANLRKSLELAKLDNETELAEKEFMLDKKVNKENEIIEYNDLDFIIQEQMSNENLSFQTEVKNLFEGREDSIFEYEELEASNRASIKVDFLVAQKERIEADKELFIAKINTSFENEQILYGGYKEKVSFEDLEELKLYEEEANEAIMKITDKRDALHPKKNKKEIKELNLEINNSRNKLNSYVKTKKDIITQNTESFEKGIIGVNDRRDLSIEQTEDFFTQQILRVDKAINLVTQNKNEEINNAKERHIKTFENTSLLLQNAQLRNNQLVEQTTAFKISRIQNANDVIKDTKDIFEKQKHASNESTEKVLLELETEIKSEESRINKNISKEESDLKQKVAAINKQIKDIESVEAKGLNKLASAHKDIFSKIEQKEKIEIKSIKDEYAQKESVYKAKILEINKNDSAQSKIFEANKKAVKKDYELGLAKKINDLNTKLQQDIKAL